MKKILWIALMWGAALGISGKEIDIDGSMKQLSPDKKSLIKWPSSVTEDTLLELLNGKNAGTHELYIEVGKKQVSVISKDYLGVPEKSRKVVLTFECKGEGGLGANLCFYGPKGIFLHNKNLKNYVLSDSFKTCSESCSIPEKLNGSPVRFFRVQFNFYKYCRGVVRNVELEEK